MPARLVRSTMGFLLGLVTSFILSALLLSWPLRMMALVMVLGLALAVIISRGEKPLQPWQVITSAFIAGYGVFCILLSIAEIVFPPLD